jgi:hypothetical protein
VKQFLSDRQKVKVCSHYSQKDNSKVCNKHAQGPHSWFDKTFYSLVICIGICALSLCHEELEIFIANLTDQVTSLF